MRSAGRSFVAFLVATSAGLALPATQAAAGLITNGDFANIGGVWTNNTGLGSDDYQTAGATAPPGWTVVNGNEFWFNGSSNSYGLTQSPGNGSMYAVDLTGQANTHPYGGVEQTISTTIGATYTLTFDLGASTFYNGSGFGAAAITASATGTNPDASQLFTLVPNSTNEWQSESLTFTADSTMTTIEFLGDSAYSSEYSGLDNVDVELAATPLPAALPLFATGIGAMGLLGWRRKRKAQVVT